MRRVIHVDKHGLKRVCLLRDSDPDSAAAQGIPVGPPDLNELDMQEVKRELNNLLVEWGVLTWRDVQRNPNAITKAARAAIVGKVVQLYKLQEVSHE